MPKSGTNKQIVISLGGSLIVPEQGIDRQFLTDFRQLILKESRKGRKFFLVVGGGTTARHYIKALEGIIKAGNKQKDWLGIYSTHLNAHFLRLIFGRYAFGKIVKSPKTKVFSSKKIIIAGGWRPGSSTDYVAVLIAQRYKSKTIINLSNIDYLYTADPRKDKNAKRIEKISWKNFRELVGRKWRPGLNSPFDPVASKKAQELGLRVIIMNGRNLKNLENYLSEKPFKGTIID